MRSKVRLALPSRSICVGNVIESESEVHIGGPKRPLHSEAQSESVVVRKFVSWWLVVGGWWLVVQSSHQPGPLPSRTDAMRCDVMRWGARGALPGGLTALRNPPAEGA
eukprot:6308501-Pyramimonas_sp.AAC.1